MKSHVTFSILSALPLLLAGTSLRATTVSHNTGSLGAIANGTNTDLVAQTAGALAAGGDQAANYGSSGANTSIPFQPALNPSVLSPFTIEFWANPSAADGDDTPVSNRVSAGNRSGWVFFQRRTTDNPTGWNFRMYNGIGGGLGWDLTGGASTLNTWHHVVATWNGSAAQLYVNGVLADSSNDPGANGVYNPSGSATLFVAQSDSGSPYTGAVDEVAFYGSELSGAQISNHFNTALTSPADYHSLVLNDGALLQLTNNPIPEPSSLAVLGLSGLALLRRRVRSC